MASDAGKVLDQHFVMWHEVGGDGPPGEWRCSCGKKFGFSDSAIEHQAAALEAEVIRPREREAWELGHRGLCRRHGRVPFTACRNPFADEGGDR